LATWRGALALDRQAESDDSKAGWRLLLPFGLFAQILCRPLRL